MDKKQLQEILTQPFNSQSWLDLVKSVFGARQLLAQPKEIILPKNDKADTAYELGSFTTSDDRVIGLYKVNVSSDVWLDRNKVGLRELLRNVYKYDVDGALIVFEQDEKWRLSFVSEIKVLNEEGEVIKRATEPKRYTYLLGVGEKVLTPSIQLSRLVRKSLSLEDIREAFSVEALNEEFYKIISDQFYKLVGGNVRRGSKSKKYEAILKLPGLSPNQNRRIYQEFAVRLIGRIVFCWFLKMKKSEEGKALLPEELLSSSAVKKYHNYYHSILEKIFFQILNTPIPDRVDGLPGEANDIPFLNGGLFEPDVEDYYKANSVTGLSEHLNTLKIEDHWFLEFFGELEKYNFTIDENSITEVEVSIDPEMLGRIFENLLAEIDPDTGESARKATGSFYTPREVVAYMATESLVQYLHNKSGFDKDQLRLLFRMTEEEVSFFSVGEKEKILEALNQVRILDPACGSGAFPMGVLQKIVIALQKIDPQAAWWKARQIEKIDNAYIRQQIKSKMDQASIEYARKIGIIQNSLYGVDIQPIAAEISKLRCFLTLVVDENIDESKPNRGVEPLPNLEFKFVTADTLLSLPKEENFGGLFNSNDDLEKLKKLRIDYLQSFGDEKKHIKSRFKAIQDKIIKSQFELGKNLDVTSRAYLISSWDPFSHDLSSWFDPEWMFGVKGFDLIIGNPPYVQLQKDGGALAKKYFSQSFQTFERMGDIYSLFYEKGNQLLKKEGVLCFITSNKWMRAGYGASTRNFFVKETNPILLIDFAGQKVFKSATVDTNILLFSKGLSETTTEACVIKEKSIPNLGVYISKHRTKIEFNNGDSWVVLSSIEQGIKDKIEKIGKPLKDWDVQINYGIKTGYNEAFIISGEKKNELIAKDPKSAEIIRPILRGRDIKRYHYQFADLWLIATFPSMNYDIEQYPAIKEHLLSFGYDRLKQTGERGSRKKTNNEWFETQDSINYWEDFFRPKIVWGEISDNANFVLDESGKYFINNKCYLLSGSKLEYLVCFLNSPLSEHLFSKIATTTGVGTLQWSKFTIGQLFVPTITDKQEKEFLLSLSELKAKKIDITSINSQIYRICGLSHDEIVFIESLR